MTIGAASDKKIVIAHRGASAYLPEHTLAAKAMAHAMKVDFIEQDVVLSKDGVPIVLHDHFLDTVTDVAVKFPARSRIDGRYYAIDFTLREIKTLNAHERIDLTTGEQAFPQRFPTGLSTFCVPTLEEELELIAGLNQTTGRTISIYPEIKAPAFHRSEGQDITRIVLQILNKHGYMNQQARMFLQCFDFHEVKRIRNEFGYDGRLVQLIGENSWRESPDVDFDYLRTPEGLDEIAKVADAIAPRIIHLIDAGGALTDLGARARMAGLEIHPYTLRADALPHWASTFNAAMTRLFKDAKVQGIFTDHPDLAVHFLMDF